MNDILGFDDIEVKQVSKSKWTNIKSFYFPEEHENEVSSDQNYYIGEDGQVNFHNQKENKNSRTQQYVIDEFGQVVSQNNIGGGSHLTYGHRQLQHQAILILQVVAIIQDGKFYLRLQQ